MRGRNLFQRMSGLALVVLLLAGCGGAQAVPTAVSEPPIATPAPITWDYVALGDSMTMGFVNKYANHIETDLGIEVKVHYWSRGGQGSHQLLRELRNNEELRNDIREAEIVTFDVSPQHFEVMDYAYKDGECGGQDNQDCLWEALALVKADTDAIIAEILSLRSTSDTIIRAMTCPVPLVNWFKEEGLFEGVHPYWVAYNEYIVQAASENNIPVARIYRAFNGPNGDEDFDDKGYSGPGKIHPTDAGKVLIAELFRELGYEPLAP